MRKFLILLPLILILASFANVHCQSDSAYTKCMAQMQLLQSGMIQRMLLMQSYTTSCDESMIKEDITVFQNKYLPAVNGVIDSCNHINYTNDFFASQKQQNILTWVNAMKQQYGNCVAQIQINADNLQQRRKSEAINNMLAGLLKLAISTYLPGIK